MYHQPCTAGKQKLNPAASQRAGRSRSRLIQRAKATLLSSIAGLLLWAGFVGN